MCEAQTLPCFAVTAAFEAQLKTLCLKEFPCGYGSWRVPDAASSTTIKSTIPSPRVVLSNTDTSAQLETVEGLQELANKTPYTVDCSWSNEAKPLREIAVIEPDKLTDAFISKFFKSLRIVDKKVTEIDEGLLQFTNLKQLTLSANLITRVDSRRLPEGLEELELASNRITDIASLCFCPPPLIHLGLGYNCISSIVGLMRPEYWLKLLSLDLSYNNLTHLHYTIIVLKLLPKLKNLVLQGNPLALTPGYRGHTIDSIRKLTILDDIRISADEKHYFKGLSKLKEIRLDEAQVTISVSVVRNVKKPDEVEDPDSQPEYPKTEHKYHAEFRFLREPQEVTQPCQSPAPSLPTISVSSHPGDCGKAEDAQTVMHDGEEDLYLKTVKTESLPWAEEAIELNYTNRFSTSNLALLRDFLKQGIDFTVIETKHSYVVEDPSTPPAPGDVKSRQVSAKSHRPDSKLRKSSSKEKTKDSSKGREKGKEGKGKKGKQEDVELFELPRQHKSLGSCHVVLTSLLDGEFQVTSECECHGGERSEDKSERKDDDTAKTDGSEKKKGGKAESSDKSSKANLKGSASGKASKRERGKSAQKTGKDHKEDERKMKKIEESFDEEEILPPPPLSLSTKIVLHSWKSAREATLEISRTQNEGTTMVVEPCSEK